MDRRPPLPGAVRRRGARLSVHAGRSRQNQPAVNFNKKFPGSAEAVINYEVQGPFTKSGWDFMKNALKNADKFFAGERWVLGDYAGASVDRVQLGAELRDALLRRLHRPVAHLTSKPPAW